MSTNHADGNDQVAVQIGRVGGRRRRDERQAADDTAARVAVNVNVCSDTARVGLQADVVEGDVTINF